jgi:hypothetical protein
MNYNTLEALRLLEFKEKSIEEKLEHAYMLSRRVEELEYQVKDLEMRLAGSDPDGNFSNMQYLIIKN